MFSFVNVFRCATSMLSTSQTEYWKSTEFTKVFTHYNLNLQCSSLGVYVIEKSSIAPTRPEACNDDVGEKEKWFSVI